MTQYKKNLRVWDALFFWRDFILNKDIYRRSKTLYLCNMAKLLEAEIINVEQPLSEFIKTNPEEKIQLINKMPWSQSMKTFRHTMLISFYNSAKSNKIKKIDITIPFKEFRNLNKAIITELLSSSEIKAQAEFLTYDDIARLITEMRTINFRDAVVCWMMFEYKITLGQALNLHIRDIDFSNGITLKDGTKRLGEMRPDLKQDMQVLIAEREGLLFVTDKGTPVKKPQIIRNMKLVSQRLKFPLIISPKILYTYATAYSKEVFRDMSEHDKNYLAPKMLEKYTNLSEKENKSGIKGKLYLTS